MELTEWMAYLTCLTQEQEDKNRGGRMKWNDG